MRVCAVIFDLDGVLADSEPWWNQIDAKLLAQYGVDYHGEHHREVLGVSYRLAVEFYKKAFRLSVATEEIMKRRGEIAAEFFADRVGLFPGTKEVLEELKKMKLRLGLATSSVSASARPFLDRHGLTPFFEVIVTGDEVEHGKPAPDIYLCAAEKLALSPDVCLVVEDALSGIAAAKAAKMRVAAIPDIRPSGPDRFVDPHEYNKEADYVLSDLAEIPKLIGDLGLC
jgi:HAD superfamily hydrolase (TIGR01509 family)